MRIPIYVVSVLEFRTRMLLLEAKTGWIQIS
jgi:hypothetical protein